LNQTYSKIMKKTILLALLFLQSIAGFSQTQKLEDVCQVFHLPDGKDTTTFVVWGSKESLKIKKPLFFFRQGSRPEPLIEIEGGKYYLRFPFAVESFKDKYHLVMVQKSGTRLVADSTYLQAFNEGMKTGDSRFLTKIYQENNNLDKATAQCNQVINYLVKQPWIDTKKIVFCGGSEGFTVGANLVANFNKSVTHTILFSGHAGRRFEYEIYRNRQAVREGKMTAEEAQKQIEELYKGWEDVCKYPKSIDKSFGDTYYAWHSFSTKNLDNLLKINTPLYIAYGTEDGEVTIGLDYLPLDFIEKGKKNLTLKAYVNHDHQFVELKKDASGKVVDKVYQGDKVSGDFMEWLGRN
jgi:dienelactone hydrolase